MLKGKNIFILLKKDLKINMDHLQNFNKLNENYNSKIQETNGLIERINKLVDFLDRCSNTNYECKVSAGDIMGYICGYMDITSEPEDEIEVFD